MDIDSEGHAEGMAKFIASLCLEFLDEVDPATHQPAYKHHDELSISADKCLEVAQFTHRDMARISTDQNDEFSRQKFSAYHGFWFVKLKPLSNVFRAEAPDTEVVDVNERFALALMRHLIDITSVPVNDQNRAEFALATGFETQPTPIVWEKCQLDCDRQCFRNQFSKYMSFHDSQNFEYLVHSLRRRATGPYDLVNVAESLVYSGCK